MSIETQVLAKGSAVEATLFDGRVIKGRVYERPDALAKYQDYMLVVSSVDYGCAGPARYVGILTTLVDGVMRERRLPETNHRQRG